MTEITPAEQIRLNLLATLNYDTAAAAQAIEFVQDSSSNISCSSSSTAA
ncbi:Uncharacterised protein [Klebsiella pneumoniae]|nr:Uncharacterised protein [Klebsiella pneumoniae]